MSSPDRQVIRRRRAAVCAWVLLAAIEAVWAAAPPPASWVEAWYSRGLYRLAAAALVPLTDLAPVSLSLLVLALLVLAWPPILVRGWRRRRARGQTRRGVLAAWLWGLGRTAIAAYALFLLVWGAGYRRQPLEDRLGLEGDPPRAGDISRWLDFLTARIHRDAQPAETRDPVRALASLRRSLAATVEAWDGAVPALPRRVKRLPAGSLLAFGSAGMISPFFLEAHIDAGDAEASGLFTSAHELAHVAGFCSEADADFAAATAGLRADDSYARYATAISLWRKFRRYLDSGDPRRSEESLPQVARDDLEAASRAWARYHAPRLARVQARVYDAYLRSQGSKEGLREYARLPTLLVQAERKGIVQLE